MHLGAMALHLEREKRVYGREARADQENIAIAVEVRECTGHPRRIDATDEGAGQGIAACENDLSALDALAVSQHYVGGNAVGPGMHGFAHMMTKGAFPGSCADAGL